MIRLLLGGCADVGQRADAALPHQRPELLAPRRHSWLPGAGRVRQGAQWHSAPVVAGVNSISCMCVAASQVCELGGACIIRFDWNAHA